jgi:hypothetical protein
MCGILLAHYAPKKRLLPTATAALCQRLIALFSVA